jgi:hypothetical protein
MLFARGQAGKNFGAAISEIWGKLRDLATRD